MQLTIAQRLDRLKVRTAELSHWRERAVLPVRNWTFEREDITIGQAWPHRKGVVHFASQANVPTDWPLEETRLQLDLGGESLITLTYDGGRSERFGLDPFHQEFPLKDRNLSITTDSVARLPFGEPNRQPRLSRAQLALLDIPVHRLNLLMRQIAEAVEALDEHDVVPHLLDAAETALRSLDWPSATHPYVSRTAKAEWQQKIWELPELVGSPADLTEDERASVVVAYDILRARLKTLQERYPQNGELLLTGHAHIDLAWLWPYDETRRKMRRTFHTALSLMDRSPEFRFNQSTAHYYAQMEADDPQLFKRIKEKVADGSWEVIGGMWVEPDTNMPTGESLVRQILYGQRYFEKTFGARHTVCWLPDCFGFSGALPQLLRQGGIDSFFTIKVNWSETNKFPYDLFWWEGLDGSQVLAHTFDNPMQGYNGFVQPDCFMPTWKNFRAKTLHDTSLLAVGYGDGGGGVTPEMVEREVQLRDFPAIPKARWGKVADFFMSAHRTAREKRLPTWSGEIYLELHRATLTSQSGVKRLHRRAEQALITAETLASIAHMIGGAKPPSLEADWRVTLKNEFHDILPGSSIREVYQDAERELSDVIDHGKVVQRDAVDAIVSALPKGGIVDALVVINPSLDARPLRAVFADGMVLSTEDIISPLSIHVLDRAALKPAGGFYADARRLENEHLAVTIGADGAVRSLVHKATGRQALAAPANQLWIYPVDKPRNWDAWDIDADYSEKGIRLDKPESIELVENNAHRAAIKVVHRHRDSSIVQHYVLTANARRLDIETEIDWHDRRTMLRSLSPVATRAHTATFECAYGVVSRPTHTNTSWDAAMFEAVAHRFIDLSEPDFGVALLNDAKYGHSARGNVLGISLVRGSIYPDPLADEGEQRFTYALYPHGFEWHSGRVREEADDLNQPLVFATAANLAETTVAAIAVTGTPVALSAVKPAEDGDGLVLRVYEPAGRRGKLSIAPLSGWTISEAVNLMEEPTRRDAGPDILPFEVRSWKIKRM
ncbi:glycoside hydrolase family 38 C-terminal domain-containing protein [Rhizobium calliandrae]|uniref:Glycoside hydrolase family 38 C-terminal domain-containing protein n=1 Tax=Rhizobium calliandrae TaxID=1312182 RepID=A0ABT7KMQ6_9HYPH|nr:glycoside hydrolase family 38 C-terminal domain-containing protein [Rhizobium calliandrae]MDL2408529.1 glycoside hydrolase family 38 C-terminal domain-containing protein [Rhizobium calliandrae]